MDTTSVAKTEAKTEETPRRVHVVTPEERKARTAAAKTFLAVFGRDDVDTHASCFERLR